MFNGAVTRPWKSKRHSPSLIGRWPKAGVTPPGRAPTCGADGSSVIDGSSSVRGAVLASCARAATDAANTAAATVVANVNRAQGRDLPPGALPRPPCLNLFSFVSFMTSPPDVDVDGQQLI